MEKKTDESKNDNRKNKNEETPIYLTSDSTLQTPSEHRHDQSIDATKDTIIQVSRDDLNEIQSGTITGRDDIDNDH